ncbi:MULTISPECIES: antitoxin [Gordonibacter]|uniref:Antitoxin n=2 Tax=Gordonibacter urolithinfaciens TaxID=1335613 RepID=A0A6N8INI6_9ACTN|nr:MULTISPECIES: antitoxin [Gordonibacter]MBS6974205.1 hypothetical protein [Eggerthellaceae bacterium]GKG89498.1 hypothetical protein CE91St32_05400 [Gordonibacter pamelaeae]MCB6561911.1 hypothetical protein [Gordonibacter urolithinfaciens]MCB7084936.1 hypothetical protein [Gordonibacter urolithinfaciens]MDN4469389.1 hypothetical protein [Gordonibacter sp. RACS_AR68]
MKTAKELEEMFGVTAEQLDEWEKEAAQGILPGEQVGEIIVGRPLKFGEPLQFVGFKDTPQKVAAMDERASKLGMSRSDYLRSLVRKDLASA